MYIRGAPASRASLWQQPYPISEKQTDEGQIKSAMQGMGGDGLSSI